MTVAALNDFSVATLRDRYLLPDEPSPDDGFRRCATAFADNPAHAERLLRYMQRLWFVPASPVLSNAPVRLHWETEWARNFLPHCFDGRLKGQPISCFLNSVPDSRKGLSGHYDENIWLSSNGGGIGSYWGAVRSDGTATRNGSRSSGVIPFLKVADAQTSAFSQGTTRRGAYAAYLDISHPEIGEFLHIRKETGGDAARRCLNIHHGVVIPDDFMAILEACMTDPAASPDWPLIDPHSLEVVDTVDARDLWEALMTARAETGEPYLLFIDTVRRHFPDVLKRAGLNVTQSNLCTEITLATDADRTAVCCLSSVNLATWDGWRDDPLFIYDLVRFLDNVLEFFIQNAPPAMHRAVRSAIEERSLGLGAMGFHDLLQSKLFPIDSAMAVGLNRRIFRHLHGQAIQASENLAEERGEPSLMAGTGRRNAHVIAIAPNATTSIIAGTSPSIEPWRANAFNHKTQSGFFLVKNPHLDRLLRERLSPAEYDAAWRQVITDEGSAQGLACLSDWEKDVFRTAPELDQLNLIRLAGDRQPYVCQAQSLNLFFQQGTDVAYYHAAHLLAWKRGLKSLYYVRSAPRRRAEVVSDALERHAIEFDDSACSACTG